MVFLLDSKIFYNKNIINTKRGMLKDMEEKKTYIGKAVLILVVIILASVIGYKVYSDIQSRKLADQYVEDTVQKTETLIRRAGIPDFEIKVKDKQYAAYASEFSSPLIEMDRYCYYYHLDLYSDDIADIYRTKIENRKLEELIEMMYEIYEYANECSGYNEFDWQIIPFRDGYINAYFKHGYPQGSVFIETSSGDRYGFTVEYLRKCLYINDELIYEQLEEPIEIPTKPEYVVPTPSTNTGNRYEYTGEYYDPYGVEDYDDPDSFADEWAEEFGDGDYDDGYDDAYDYWEEEY